MSATALGGVSRFALAAARSLQERVNLSVLTAKQDKSRLTGAR